MKWLRHAVGAAVVAGVVATGGAPRTVEAVGMAGHWHIAFQVMCVNSPQNRAACEAALGGTAPIFGRKGTTFSDATDIAVVAQSNGHFTFSGTQTIVERVPGGKPLCNANIGSKPFNGTCKVSQFGSGHFQRDDSGLQAFHVDSSTAVFPGPHPARLHSANFDTRVPAVARSWKPAQYLSAYGYRKSIPGGVTVSLVVTHRP